MLTPEQSQFLTERRWALLSTTRASGAPQISMLAYHWDGTDIVFSIRSNAAKWANIGRQPAVVVTVVDDDRYLAVQGVASRVDAEPELTAMTRRLQASLLPADAARLEADFERGLDIARRVVVRVTPTVATGRI